MTKYSKRFIIRWDDNIFYLIDKIVKENPQKYTSVSQWIRSACIKELRKGYTNEWAEYKKEESRTRIDNSSRIEFT